MLKKYKTFETLCRGKLQQLRNLPEPLKKKEAEIIIEEILNTFINFYNRGNREIVIERIGLVRDGTGYDIYRGFDNGYKCWLYEAETPIEIMKEDINFMFRLVLDTQIGIHYSARYFFKKIIGHQGLPINCDEFSGGKNRAKYYFPLYICPLKIIEKETGMIKVTMGKGGGFWRIK